MSNTKPGNRQLLMFAAGIVLILGGTIAGGTYLATSSKTVYIEKAHIEAPEVLLTSISGGVLRHTYVSVGDVIAPNTVVAQVGVELIKSSTGGLVIDSRTDTGASIAPGTPVVTTVDPSQLRVVGQVEEDKGLKDIHTGEPARFTVDAFGSKQFTGVVSEVSPTSRSGDVVFSISDKRATESFDVKVSFDTAAHPELRNGMSARLWVYKQ